MKRNKIFLLICLLCCTFSLKAQNRNYIEKARYVAAKEFLNSYKETMDYFKPDNKINIDSTLQHTIFEREIKTPFENIKILLFTLNAIEPRLSELIKVSANSIEPIVIDSKHSVTDLLNNFLDNGPKHLTDDDLLKIPSLWSQLESPYYKMNIVLNSWKDIDWKENEKVDETLKEEISHPLTITKDNNKKILFYYWKSGTTELYKINLIFNGKLFSSDRKFLGKYGQYHIIL